MAGLWILIEVLVSTGKGGQAAANLQVSSLLPLGNISARIMHG